MVLDQLGIAKQLPDSQSNPQNIFIGNIAHLTNRVSLAGALANIHQVDVETGTIGFLNGNMNAQLKFRSTSGYTSGRINKDHGENHANGFMQDPKDFRNFEFSTYIYLTNAISNGYFRIHGRGGEAYGPLNLESTAVGIDLGFDGRIRAFKTRRYPDVNNFTPWANGIGDLEGRWVGFKAVFYNVNDNNAVKYILYLDTDLSNKWEKQFEIVDDGHGILGGAGSVGNGSVGQPITWGGPLVFFKWFGCADPDGVLLQNVSLREIDATSVGGSPSIPTTQQNMTQTPEGTLEDPDWLEKVSGTSPATTDIYGVQAIYATGDIIYGGSDWTLQPGEETTPDE